MIQLAAALLCDSASVRENLLGVLGGGITNISRPDFPAPINCDLALSFYAMPESGQDRHRIEVILLSQDDEELSRMETGFELDSNVEVIPGETVSVPLVVSLASIGVPGPGLYRFEVMADQSLLASVPFRVEEINSGNTAL